ncbi:Dabb family protein [Cellulomonas bogoriensis]
MGRNTTTRDCAYDFCVIGVFADRAALARYMNHPDHMRGVQAWSQISTWVVADLDLADDESPLGVLAAATTRTGQR